MDGISRSRGWDKEIPHGVLPMEQLVLSDKWARKIESIIVVQCRQGYPNGLTQGIYLHFEHPCIDLFSLIG